MSFPTGVKVTVNGSARAAVRPIHGGERRLQAQRPASADAAAGPVTVVAPGRLPYPGGKPPSGRFFQTASPASRTPSQLTT